jgi:hypothetical protein
MNRRSGVKMFLSVITAPIELAQLIDFLIRRCHVKRTFILQIRSATPIQDMNTSAPICWRWRVISATTNGAVNIHILNRQDSPTPSLASECALPPPPPTKGLGGGGHTCLQLMGWESTNSDIIQYLHYFSIANKKGEALQKFATLRLFVMTMPI